MSENVSEEMANSETGEPSVSVSAEVGAVGLTPPAWMLREEKPTVASAETPTMKKSRAEGAGGEVGALILDLVVAMHNRIAEWTGYVGFKLDEDDKRIWLRVSNMIARFVPFEKMPEMLIIVSVLMVEMSKVGGYVVYRKQRGVTPTP